jgi:hypothetical protein
MEGISINKNSFSISQFMQLDLEVFDLQEIKTELVRKSIHFLIALSPSMAALNRPFTVVLLMVGTLFYAVMESFRLSGIEVPLCLPLPV